MKTITLFTSNEKGGVAALLSVVVLSTIIVTALSSVYVFLENRARFQGGIKTAYQTTYSMEEAARVMSQGWDIARANNIILDTDVCPNGLQNIGMSASVNGAIVTERMCVPNSNAGAGNAGVCVTNPSLGPNPICLTSYNKNEILNKKETMIASWYKRMDQFFDTTVVKGAPQVRQANWNFLETEIQPPSMFGWLLPQKAHASSLAWAHYFNNPALAYEQNPVEDLPYLPGGGTIGDEVVDPPYGGGTIGDTPINPGGDDTGGGLTQTRLGSSNGAGCVVDPGNPEEGCLSVSAVNCAGLAPSAQIQMGCMGCMDTSNGGVAASDTSPCIPLQSGSISFNVRFIR